MEPTYERVSVCIENSDFYSEIEIMDTISDEKSMDSEVHEVSIAKNKSSSKDELVSVIIDYFTPEIQKNYWLAVPVIRNFTLSFP